MPDPISATIAAVTTIGSGVIGGNAAKSAASTSADATLQAQREAIAAQKQGLSEQRQQWAPFAQAGLEGLTGLQGLVNDPSAALGDYYNSPQFAMMQEQAGRGQLAASEAMGGMGATSTGNALAGQQAALGQDFLNNRFNQLSGMTNIGLQATGAGSAATGQAGSNISNLAMQGGMARGNALAGGQLAQGQAWGNALNTMGGMYMGGKMGGLF